MTEQWAKIETSQKRSNVEINLYKPSIPCMGHGQTVQTQIRHGIMLCHDAVSDQELHCLLTAVIFLPARPASQTHDFHKGRMIFNHESPAGRIKNCGEKSALSF